MLGSVSRWIGAQEENRVAISGCLRAIGQCTEESISARKIPVEGFHNLLAHCVAAGTNRWPHDRDYFLRIRTKSPPHVSYTFFDNPCQRATPTCMDRRHHTPLRVHQEQRQAVGNSDRQ